MTDLDTGIRTAENQGSSRPMSSIITVEVEDYYHVGSFHRNIRRKNWSRFEKRIAENTQTALSLLDEFDVKATFFVLGWVAEMLPEVVTEIAQRGHEIASKGYNHQTVYQLTPAEFREELQRGREALERASGRKINGYRVAHRWLTPSDLWILDVLAEEGYAYDSSIGLIFRRFASEPWRGFVHEHQYGDKRLWEFPLSSWNLLGLSIPIAGGNYYRQFPHTLVKQAVERWHQKYDAPFVMYFHIWELDPNQPRINTSSFLTNIRHYRNLDKMHWVLRDYFQKYRFTSIANYLRIDSTSATDGRAVAKNEIAVSSRKMSQSRSEDRSISCSGAVATEHVETHDKVEISIVIPCYNEVANLKYLANTLGSVQNLLGIKYEVHAIFVDDCSTDDTWEKLNELFGPRSNCHVFRHSRNQGVAAAILTGIRHAKTDIVCSIDCDCTYDPHELINMIPLLTDEVDLVTASPYHSQGQVWNVPRWRLLLSRSASVLYRLILGHFISTYTSCYRVYRRNKILGLPLKEGGFLGIAEVVGLLCLQGSKIVEYPTTLESRVLGQSSMKILKNISGHFRLILRLLTLRLRTKRVNNKRQGEKVLFKDELKNVDDSISPQPSKIEK